MSDNKNILPKMTLNDWIKAVGIVITCAGVYYGMSYRMQALEESSVRMEKSIEKIDNTIDRINSKMELDIQNLKNDVNATTMRLELLKQEVDYLKKR